MPLIRQDRFEFGTNYLRLREENYGAPAGPPLRGWAALRGAVTLDSAVVIPGNFALASVAAQPMQQRILSRLAFNAT